MLPDNVIEKDHKLAKAGEQLMELRWHWTLNKSNPDRVSAPEYAKATGVHSATIKRDAAAWEAFTKAKAEGLSNAPGAPKTATDFRRLAQLGEDRQAAIKAVAAKTGNSVAYTERRQRAEVESVLNAARARVERKKDTTKPTTIEHEIEKAAEWQVKAKKAAEADRAAKKGKHTQAFIKVERKYGTMFAAVRDMLNITEGVEFDEDEAEILDATHAKLLASLGLLKLRISGEIDVDWDSEFEKITAGKGIA